MDEEIGHGVERSGLQHLEWSPIAFLDHFLAKKGGQNLDPKKGSPTPASRQLLKDFG